MSILFNARVFEQLLNIFNFYLKAKQFGKGVAGIVK